TASRSGRKPLPGEANLAEQLDLRVELDAEAFAHQFAPRGDQRDNLRRAGAAGVLDEVCVLRREAGSAEAQLAGARLREQLPGARSRRVFEGRAERPDPLRLGGVTAFAHARERRANGLRRARAQR